MVGICFCVLVIASILCAVCTGNGAALCAGALSGARGAVELTLSLLGMMCLWGGVMEVFRDCGAIGALARVLSPLTRRLFPTAYRTGRGMGAITAALCANLLGIGNAATPLAVRAMEEMAADSPTPGVATDDMVTFTVLGTCSLDLLPTTIVTMRYGAGSARPYAVMAPILLVSGICAVFGAALARLLRGWGKKRNGGTGDA